MQQRVTRPRTYRHNQRYELLHAYLQFDPPTIDILSCRLIDISYILYQRWDIFLNAKGTTITRKNKQYPRRCGVYLLCVGKAIVYIGASENVHARIEGHGLKFFNRIYGISVSKEDVLDVEQGLISYLKPFYNGISNNMVRVGCFEDMFVEEYKPEVATVTAESKRGVLRWSYREKYHG